ncbi:MAG: hypothetical protein WAJ85_11690 [Candidatus Baltobacteraceae bacterium]|jgi:hypothetical protein
MFGVVRQYRTDPGQIDAIVSRTRERFMHPISKAWSFVSWTLIDAGADGVVTASVFDDEIGAEVAAGWVRENQAALALGHPKVTEGPIVFREVKEHVHAGYGFLLRYACKPGETGAVAARIRDGFIPSIAAMPGYAGYGSIDAGHGIVVSLLVFADRESAQAGERCALAWAQENIAALISSPPEVVFGEIKLRIPASATVNA